MKLVVVKELASLLCCEVGSLPMNLHVMRLGWQVGRNFIVCRW